MTTPLRTLDTGLRWTLHASCPADWRYSLSRFNGSFFHTSRGLALSAPPGEISYCELLEDREVTGVAAGVRYRTEEDGAPRHMYFATVPALANRPRRDAAIVELLQALAAEGIGDVVLDSLDASWLPAAVLPPRATIHRREYIVDLEPSLMAMVGRCAPTHQRRIDQYETAGWRVRRLAEHEARAVLAALDVSETHCGRHDGAYASHTAPLIGVSSSRLGEDSGSAVYAAFDGDLPVAASMVGWTGHRAYHVHGGSVSGNEPMDAELWLQWKIMRDFAVAGFFSYNLGGLPARAVDPGHHLSAIHRIRMGFRPRVTECLSVRWTLGSRASVPTPETAGAAGADWTGSSGESWRQ